MPQDKKPLGLTKPKQRVDNTKVSKMVKDPKVGPNYSEMNKMENWKYKKLDAKDSADYREGYRVGYEGARKGKLTKPDKKGNPQLAWYIFRGKGSGFLKKQFAESETPRYAEGRFEGEKRGLKK